MDDSNLANIFRIPRILGTFPFDGKFRLSMKLAIYGSSLQFATTLANLQVLLSQPMRREVKDFWTYLVISLLATVGSSVSSNFVNYWLILKRHRVFDLFDGLKEIGIRRDITLPKKRFRLAHCYLIACFLLFMISNYMARFDFTATYRNILLILTLLPTVSFYGYFWDAMQLLNALIRETTRECDENSIDIFGELSSSGELFNEIYGPVLLFTITSTYLRVVLALYLFLLPVFPGVLLWNPMMVSWTMFHIVPLLLIIYSCTVFKNLQNKFHEDLYFKILEDKTALHVDNEKFCFHILAYKEVHVSAFGYFNVDHLLICSMISASTTYLVIVLQYGQG